MIEMSIAPLCKVCGVTAVVKSCTDLFGEKINKLECSHVAFGEIQSTSKTTIESIVSTDGKKLMPFQVSGVKFAEKANARCLIADEQGLGKTVQADALLFAHPELLPAVIVTKSAIKIQHVHEVYRWMDTKKVQVIFSSNEIAVPGMDVYITSYDMLKAEKVWAFIEPKTLILDECQKIKNHTSGRAKAVIAFASRCEHVIGLSGTPIMNNAGEYFTILHLIKPDLFPDFYTFIREHCDSYENMYGPKVGGLRDPIAFREYTKDFIIRRTLEEVMPDLFAFRTPRQFHHVELDRKVNKAYAKALSDLEEVYYGENSVDTQGQILAIMNRMRQITGVSKTIECADYIEDFVDSCDRKIAIFAHHHAAVDLLEQKVNEYLRSRNLNDCVMVRSGDDTREKIGLFSPAGSRVLIASGQAAGEGMDGLQLICNDGIILERQWNPAIEEQIESRLIRYGQTKAVTFTYFLASETIDEYFAEIVEQKRSIKDAALDGKNYQWDQSSLLKELAGILVSKGKKKWSL